MNLEKIEKESKKLLKDAASQADLEAWRIKFLGRKSELALFLRTLAERSLEERRTLGEKGNELRKTLENLYEERKSRLGQKKSSHAALDITQPGKKYLRGHLHPLTLVMRKMLGIFSSMGFEIVEGPEIETEYYNFDALNIPSWHPARDMFDTFWLKPQLSVGSFQSLVKNRQPETDNRQLLLRTHTSPMQIRYMERHSPPFRIVVPGRVYRHEATDARHESQFYQIEGLMVGDDVSFANFKAVMEQFLQKLFGSDTKLQLRAAYFPFTEPSFEVMMTCVICRGKGTLSDRTCKVCGGEKWLEMGGAGMVHPQVLRNVGYNPDKVQGFAFGISPDRFTMFKFKIDDIRLFYSGDLRFINQF